MTSSPVVFAGDPLDEYFDAEFASATEGGADAFSQVDAAPVPIPSSTWDATEAWKPPHELMDAIERHLQYLVRSPGYSSEPRRVKGPAKDAEIPLLKTPRVYLVATGLILAIAFSRTRIAKIVAAGLLANVAGLVVWSDYRRKDPRPAEAVEAYLSSYESFDSAVSADLYRLRKIQSIWSSVLRNSAESILDVFLTTTSKLRELLDVASAALARLASEAVFAEDDLEALDDIMGSGERTEDPADGLVLCRQLHLLVVRSLAHKLERNPEDADRWLLSSATHFRSTAKEMNKVAAACSAAVREAVDSPVLARSNGLPDFGTEDDALRADPRLSTLRAHLNLALQLEPSPELSALLRLAAAEADSLCSPKGTPIGTGGETFTSLATAEDSEASDPITLDFTEEPLLSTPLVFEHAPEEGATDLDVTATRSTFSRAERIAAQREKRDSDARKAEAREQATNLLLELKSALAIRN